MSTEPDTTSEQEQTAAADEQRTFMQWLLAQRTGGLHSDLTEQLAQVVAGAVEHQKPGQLTLTIKVKPMENGLNVMVSDTVTAKVPQADKSASLFFTDTRGNLSRENPYQTRLPIRELPPRDQREAG